MHTKFGTQLATIVGFTTLLTMMECPGKFAFIFSQQASITANDLQQSLLRDFKISNQRLALN